MVRLQNTTRNLAAIAALLVIGAAAPRAHAQDRLVSWGLDFYGQVSGTPAGTFTAVSAGSYYSVAIRTDGTLVAWGDDYKGEVSGIPGGTFTAVDAGVWYGVAIRTDGTLASWGDDYWHQVSGTPGGTFSAVAADQGLSVAIRTDGTLVAWGDISGVIGTPDGTFSAVAVGPGHRVAIRTDGNLVSWGINDYGTVSGTPAGTFTAVAAGWLYSVAIRTDGTLASWGYDGYGQVSGTPDGTFIAVAANAYHCVAIRTNGTLVSWGTDYYGEVSGTPAGTFTAVAAGDFHGVAIGVPAGSTPVGSDVVVEPEPTVTLTFDNVTGAGTTTVTTSSGGPPPPSGFRVGSPPTYYEISTTATFSDSIEVCIDYSGVSYAVESNLRLLHDDGSGWADVTSSLDTTNNIICGIVTSLSPFVIVEPDNQPPLATDDFFGMNQSSSLSVPGPGILANDTDADNDGLTVQLLTSPAHAASFQLNPDGSFSYTPPPNFYGEDTFTYKAYDGTAYSEIATVHITVSQPGSQGFITGGGKFFQAGSKCTFGFVAKVQGAGVQGNLEFQDHDAGLNVKSQSVQWVYAPNQIDGYFSGTCRVNGVTGYTFFVQVHDHGQPGSNDDLAIWVFDSFNNAVYTAGALLAGGNIVIHGN